MAKSSIECKLSLILLFFTVFISLLLPLIIEFVATYASPTSSYSILIKRSGKLEFDSSSILSKYWRAATDVEVQYPLPATLLAIFGIITNIPEALFPFIPITGFANIIFFALSKQILYVWDRKRIDIFSALYYTTSIIIYLIGGQSIGRAVFGVTLLTYFLYSYILLLKSSVDPQGVPRASALTMVTLFTLAIGFSYYAALICVLMVTLFAPVIVKLTRIKFSALHIPVMSILLIVHQPLYFSLLRQASLMSFFKNLLDFIEVQLKIESESQSFFLHVGDVDVDILSRLGGVWFPTVIKLLSIFAVVYSVLGRIFHDKGYDKRKTILWAYSLFVLLLSLGELSYSFATPTISVRFLSLYGLVVLLCLSNHINNSKHNPSSYRLIQEPEKIIRAILFGIIVISCVGYFQYMWLYGLQKPLGYQKINPTMTFCTTHASNAEPVFITADAYYSSMGFFHSTILGKFVKIAYEPLGIDAVILSRSLLTNNIDFIISRLHSREIGYLMIVNELRPIWGDGWGYAASLRNVSLIETLFSQIYNDGQSLLLKVPNVEANYP